MYLLPNIFCKRYSGRVIPLRLRFGDFEVKGDPTRYARGR